MISGGWATTPRAAGRTQAQVFDFVRDGIEGPLKVSKVLTSRAALP